jgi:hypothetical protein
LPGKRSNIVCPRCKKIGGFLQKRWIKRVVNIPRLEKIINISQAWDYATKVCLRLREHTILFPPSMPFDEEFAQSIYNMFDFVAFDNSQEIIRMFELHHLSTPAKNIKTKKKQLNAEVKRTTERGKDEADVDYSSNKYPSRNTIHTSLPPNSGFITKSSVAFLYGAIICSVLRDKSRSIQFPPNVSNGFTKAIYCYFSLLDRDLRHSGTWFDLINILIDIENHGYHAAAVRNSAATAYCKNCSNARKNHFVEMHASDTCPPEWKCSQCRGTEQLRRNLTTKHLRNMRTQILKKIEDMANYLPLFEKVKSMYRYTVDKNKEDVMKCFREYEGLARKDLLSRRECYFVVHYDSSKKWKKTSCHIPDDKLASVEINDDRYFRKYKPLISEFANRYITNSVDKHRMLSLFEDSCNILKNLGWPEQHIRRKIYADWRDTFLSLYSQHMQKRSVTSISDPNHIYDRLFPNFL